MMIDSANLYEMIDDNAQDWVALELYLVKLKEIKQTIYENCWDWGTIEDDEAMSEVKENSIFGTVDYVI